MRPFRFRLERVLEWRRRQEEIRQWDLAQGVALAQRLETERLALAKSRRQAQLSAVQAETATAADLWMLHDYLAQADRQSRVLAGRLAQQDRVVRDLRTASIEARRRREALETLRQSRYDEWRREANRELESFASEAFLARWGSRRGGL